MKFSDLENIINEKLKNNLKEKRHIELLNIVAQEIKEVIPDFFNFGMRIVPKGHFIFIMYKGCEIKINISKKVSSDTGLWKSNRYDFNSISIEPYRDYYHSPINGEFITQNANSIEEFIKCVTNREELHKQYNDSIKYEFLDTLSTFLISTPEFINLLDEFNKLPKKVQKEIKESINERT